MIDLSEWYWVYPRGDKLELTDTIEPIAIFEYEHHAKEFAEKWKRLAEIYKGGIQHKAEHIGTEW